MCYYKKADLRILFDRVIKPDLAIMFNHSLIIPRDIIEEMGERRIINIHTSYLPYNRGVYPNFFSWLYDTPKGTTIHYVDEGIDTGDIIAQEIIYFNKGQTLRSTHDILIKRSVDLFEKYWRFIESEEAYPIPQNREIKTLNKPRDFEKYENILTHGWDTPVEEVKQYGKYQRQPEPLS